MPVYRKKKERKKLAFLDKKNRSKKKLNILLKTSFWANFNLPYDIIILSYLVKNSIKEHEQKSEKRLGAGREKSLSFTKITKEINQ